MLLEVQSHNGIKVVLDVDAKDSAKTVQKQVKDALEHAIVAKDAYIEWLTAHETETERDFRLANEEQQELIVRAKRAENVKLRGMLDGDDLMRGRM